MELVIGHIAREIADKDGILGLVPRAAAVRCDIEFESNVRSVMTARDFLTFQRNRHNLLVGSEGLIGAPLSV